MCAFAGHHDRTPGTGASQGQVDLSATHPLKPARVALVLPIVLTGCEGPQSWVSPSGVQAEAVAGLFWVMLAGAGVIWALVIGLMVYAGHVRPSAHSDRWARRFVIWGGMAAPTAVLLTLLVFGLHLLRDVTAGPADLTIEAQGEQWWWRLVYRGADGAPVAVANEVRLPVGQTAAFELSADDVIHSFWVPALGGKLDMIPGRVNRLLLTPTRTGTFRGACAEFCGEAHAQMNFPVVVMEQADYRRWVSAQAEPARMPATERERAGLRQFLATGCGACHTIRGTPADGAVGPDLTHVASRHSIGAGILPMQRQAMVRWIAHTETIKPGVRMPSFGMLPGDDIALIADYLMSLQ